MPLVLPAPVAATDSAKRAIELQKKSPLPDVFGQSVAEQLASGSVTFDTMQKMHRFFTVNKRQYTEETNLLHTENDSAMIRSWLLHGAEAGQMWAEKAHASAVEMGFCIDDPLLELYDLAPDEVYSRLSLGAWRFEYDLTPAKAARFLEDYTRASGYNLELRRAFGDSAGAVGRALFRRYYEPNPFMELANKTRSGDTEIKIAAMQDLAEINISKPPRFYLDESVLPKAVKMSVGQAGKILWGPFIAGVILAVEDHEALNKTLDGFPKPPDPTDRPKKFIQYDDMTGTYVLYFHPQGKHYVKPTEKFDGLENAVYYLVRKRTTKLPEKVARETLALARAWLVQNKMAGSVFHTLVTAWKKKKYKVILDHVPPDSDMFAPFSEFVSQLEKPAKTPETA